MTESSELHEKVDKILQRVESMDNFMPWIIKPQSAQILEQMKGYFSKQVAAAKVFLQVDGIKTVSAIGEQLSMKLPNVSREIGKLRDLGLIEPKSVGNSTIYQKTKIDKVIGLSKSLEKMIEEINGKKSAEGINNEEQTGNGNNNPI